MSSIVSASYIYKSSSSSSSSSMQTSSVYSSKELQDFSKFEKFLLGKNGYIERKYSTSCVNKNIAFKPEELAHLFNLQNNDVVSNEKNIYPTIDNQDDVLNFEVKRTILRLNCFLLFIENTNVSYEEFVRNQPEGSKLSKEFYFQIAKLFQGISDSAKESLRASCFIKMARQYRENAQSFNIQFSSDSEKFITDIIEKKPDIFPVYETLSQDAKNLLPFVFLRDSHVRHMQLCEGFENMFVNLKTKIQKGEITVNNFEKLNVLFLRWVIEDSAFELLSIHPTTKQLCLPQGSSNMKQHVALDYLFLLDGFKKLVENKSEFDIFKYYLDYKSEQLSTKNAFLTQIGVQARLNTLEEGGILNYWFSTLTDEKQKNYQRIHAELNKLILCTPTYEPAVFKNLRVKEKLELAMALEVYAEIVNKVHSLYLDMLKEHLISPLVPLNFNFPFLTFEGGKQLDIVVRQYKANKVIPNFQIDAKGNVGLANVTSSVEDAKV